MPHYEVEVLEPAGRDVPARSSFWTVETPDDEWYVEGHHFELEGRTLRVKRLEDAEPPFDQRLVCAPVE